MTHLPNVSLVAVSGIDPEGALKALRLSMRGMRYGEVVLISHRPPTSNLEDVTFRQCAPGDLASTDPANKDDYSYFMAYRLHEYVKGDFALIVHNDAYVLRPHKWEADFLKYDYIGAPWQPGVHFTPEGVNVRVGNGGFSLRSRRCLNILNELGIPFSDSGTGYFNEDGIICVHHRKALEEAGIRFAPPDVAARFSHELDCPESVLFPFGFHNYKYTSKFSLIKKAYTRLRKLL